MTWFGATNRSISPPSSFVAQPGFTVTPVSSFGDTLAYTVSRSSGSFGTHTNFNKTGSLTWNGFTYLCFLAKHWENQTLNANIDSGQLIEGMERSHQNGGTAAQWVTVSTNPMMNRTKCARRTNIDARTDPLEVSQPTGKSQQYINFMMTPGSSASAGKYLRSFGGDASQRDWWHASGGGDFTVRGDSDLMNFGDPGTPGGPDSMTPGTWAQVQFWVDVPSGNALAMLNAQTQWGGALQWVDTNWLTGGTMDIGCERDNTSDFWYFGDYFIDYTRARFVMGDNTTYSSCSRHQFQVPISSNGGWGTATVALCMNIGDFAAHTGKPLFFVDSSESVTYLGHW